MPKQLAQSSLMWPVCTRTQALLFLGDTRDALKCAKAAYESWSSSSTKINLFFTTVRTAPETGQEGDDDMAIIDLLKFILRRKDGADVTGDALVSFVCLAQMVADTRKDTQQWHVIVPILERFLSEYIELKYWRKLVGGSAKKQSSEPASSSVSGGGSGWILHQCPLS